MFFLTDLKNLTNTWTYRACLSILYNIAPSQVWQCFVSSFTDSTGDCLTLALKRRCRNAIKRHGRRRHHARRCEINFLPVVHIDYGRKSLYMDYNYNFLKCWKNLPGFARCPELRSVNETSHLICNPIRDNTKRCSTTREMVRTTCKIFEVCDQAVLISGGWNRHTSTLKHKHNLESFYWMLRQYSFKKRNIKIFFANGATGINRKCS